jgi:hypothetical protein
MVTMDFVEKRITLPIISINYAIEDDLVRKTS